MLQLGSSKPTHRNRNVSRPRRRWSSAHQKTRASAGRECRGGVKVMNDALCRHLGVSDADIARVEAEQQDVLSKRLTLFRSDRPELSLEGVTAVLLMTTSPPAPQPKWRVSITWPARLGSAFPQINEISGSNPRNECLTTATLTSPFSGIRFDQGPSAVMGTT